MDSEMLDGKSAVSEVSRRDFLKGAGVLGAGVVTAGITGCSPSEANVNGTGGEEGVAAGDGAGKKWSWETPLEPITEFVEEYDYDVVVVGAGISGLFGAMSAAEEGSKVACLEKTNAWREPVTAIAGFNSQMMKDLSYDWEAERPIAMRDLMVDNQGFCKQFFIPTWLDESGAFIDWWVDIERSHGVEVNFGTLYNFGAGYPDPPLKAGYLPGNYWGQWNIQHCPGPFKTDNRYIGVPDWTKPMGDYAIEQGCDFYFNCPGVQLIRETPTTGRVTGVIGETDAGYIKFNAAKGVILCTGAIDDDREMLECYYPEALDWIQFPSKGNNTGDGHKMALWVNAKMGTEWCSHSCGTLASATGINLHENPESSRYYWTYGPYVATTPVLWVNVDGYRFMSEDIPYFVSAPQIDCQPGKRIWSIWDSKWKEKLPTGQRPDGSFGEEVRGDGQLDYDIEKGLTLKADTLDELIEKMRNWDDNLKHYDYSRLDPDIFKSTIAKYNKLCKDGKDTVFCKADKFMKTSVEEGPFYACCLINGWVSTRGGVILNEKFQVVDNDDKPIEGLYAGGNPGSTIVSRLYGSIATLFTSQSGTFTRLAAKNCIKDN